MAGARNVVQKKLWRRHKDIMSFDTLMEEPLPLIIMLKFVKNVTWTYINNKYG